jgi:hypothetical protein
MSIIRMTVLVILTGIIYQASAQCLGSCSCTANGNNLAVDFDGAAKGDWQIRIGYAGSFFTPFSDEELHLLTTEEAPVYSVTSQHSTRAGLFYQFARRWSAEAAMFYNFSADNREGTVHGGEHKNVQSYGNISGLGDATAVVSYRWINNSGQGWVAETGLGVKAPTGQTEAKSSNNLVAPLHLQPGTGSWDPVATVRVQKNFSRWRFTEFLFAKAATTAKEHNMGNYFSAASTAMWDVLPTADARKHGVGLTGTLLAEHNTKMKMPLHHEHGESSENARLEVYENSGFTRILLSAGAVANLNNNFSIPLGLHIPVYQHQNGSQVPLEWKITAGLNVSF